MPAFGSLSGQPWGAVLRQGNAARKSATSSFSQLTRACQRSFSRRCSSRTSRRHALRAHSRVRGSPEYSGGIGVPRCLLSASAIILPKLYLGSFITSSYAAASVPHISKADLKAYGSYASALRLRARARILCGHAAWRSRSPMAHCAHFAALGLAATIQRCSNACTLVKVAPRRGLVEARCAHRHRRQPWARANKPAGPAFEAQLRAVSYALVAIRASRMRSRASPLRNAQIMSARRSSKLAISAVEQLPSLIQMHFGGGPKSMARCRKS